MIQKVNEKDRVQVDTGIISRMADEKKIKSVLHLARFCGCSWIVADKIMHDAIFATVTISMAMRISQAFKVSFKDILHINVHGNYTVIHGNNGYEIPKDREFILE